jgi:hypothetical protein
MLRILIACGEKALEAFEASNNPWTRSSWPTSSGHPPVSRRTRRARALLAQLDRLDPQLVRQYRLVLPNLANHRPGCFALEEELDDLPGLGADDAVEQHAGRDAALTGWVSKVSGAV